MNAAALSILTLLTSPLLNASSIASHPDSSSLIVYNGNIGLVHEKRGLSLDSGKQSLIYPDVASSIQTDSVNVIFPDGVSLYSQQYRFDKITAQKLAEAHLGKEVKFYIETGSGLIYKSGSLLSADSQAVVKTAQSEIYTVPVSALIFSYIPSELITKPSLIWNIDTPKINRGILSLDYLVNNISWKSDYTLKLSQKSVDLSGWITIDNRSGKAFKETRVNVLAGDIDRVQEPKKRLYMAKAAVAEMDAPAVQEVSHEGYHLYQIPFPVTLPNNQQTQIKFVDIKNIPVKRKYKAKFSNPFYLQGEAKHTISQYLEIESLDRPLPMGTVRSYSKEKETTLLLGESAIAHTPKHEKIAITLGKNFDLHATEKTLSSNSDRYYMDKTVYYELGNRSKESKTVELLVPFIKNDKGQSSVATKQQYRWENANLLSFQVSVKADSKQSFEVHYRAKKQ
ncbi:hypothetical protein [Sulfurimonas sp. HSL3-7]|uniref:DUF4139 domain-containing protein n=1 Tax=Sulfonitrofixus jiaomeiensis TaxID=3131938 RepID=UPI0031F976A2